MMQDKEKTVEVRGQTFVLHSMPASVGKYVFAIYPANALPKVGEYSKHEDASYKMLAYVDVIDENGTAIKLSTKALVDRYMDDWEMQLDIETQMLEHNSSFFRRGKILSIFKDFAQSFKGFRTVISMVSSELSSLKNTQQ